MAGLRRSSRMSAVSPRLQSLSLSPGLPYFPATAARVPDCPCWSRGCRFECAVCSGRLPAGTVQRPLVEQVQDGWAAAVFKNELLDGYFPEVV